MTFNYFIFVALLFSVTVSNAQHKRNIDLGPGMDTLFVRAGYEKKYTDNDYTLVGLFGYQTFRHGPVTETSKENINRVGLILPAKRTETLGIKAEAVMGSDATTCLIVYEAAIEKITKGRSAFISIMNLFSKEADKSPQEEPSSHLRKIKVTGKISLNDTIVNFLYENNFNRDYNLGGLSGKVWYRGDSLSLQPLKMYQNKKGKKRKGFIGFSLTKNNIIYAAADTYNDPTFYLNKTLREEEKLLVAAYLFIIASYLSYPAFVDMTPG